MFCQLQKKQNQIKYRKLWVDLLFLFFRCCRHSFSARVYVCKFTRLNNNKERKKEKWDVWPHFYLSFSLQVKRDDKMCWFKKEFRTWLMSAGFGVCRQVDPDLLLRLSIRWNCWRWILCRWTLGSWVFCSPEIRHERHGRYFETHMPISDNILNVLHYSYLILPIIQWGILSSVIMLIVKYLLK